jgi:hypothetical protein
MPRSKPCTPAMRAGRLAKAEQFLEAAELIETLLDDEDCEDAYVTMCVHAGIAASDVLCCARLGQHSEGQGHAEAVAMLQQVDDQLAKRLSVLLGMKTRSGYGWTTISKTDKVKAGRAASALVEAARQV